MQEFIIGLESACYLCAPGSCWWDKSIGTCDYAWNDFSCFRRHKHKEGKIVLKCGACGQSNKKWDLYDIYAYCGDRPFVHCDECDGYFIVCADTTDGDEDGEEMSVVESLCRDSCCRVLTEADQHLIPNFEDVVFRSGGRSIPMVFIACRALAVTHLEGQDGLVELEKPVYEYGGQGGCQIDYRGVCERCNRAVKSNVSSD